MRRVSEGIMPVSTTRTQSSPMTAIELPLASADFGSGAMKAQMPSATLTVSYDEVTSGATTVRYAMSSVVTCVLCVSVVKSLHHRDTEYTERKSVRYQL